MVTRKPVPPPANSGRHDPSSPSSALYPRTPTTAEPAPSQMQNIRSQFSSDSDVGSDNAWEEEAISKHNTGTSSPSGNGHVNPGSLPTSLRIGPPEGFYTPKLSQERLGLASMTTNPFIQKQNTGSSHSGKESSAGVWGAPERSAPPPPVPQDDLHRQMSNLSVGEPSGNPWQPHLDQNPPSKPPSMPSMNREDSGKDAWIPATAPRIPPILSKHPSLLDIDEPESPAWNEDEPSPIMPEMLSNEVAEAHQINEDRHAWDESETRGHPVMERQEAALEETQQDGWNLVDHEPLPIGAQHSGVISSDGAVLERFRPGGQAPDLPPRPSQEFPPPQPPRPIVDTTANQSSSDLMSPASNARKQKKETYEIKKITWYDVNSTQNPRISPILVQNANGPCPLLALVNALTLSTPADIETALVETLRSREQVSLGLLLDAVIDELMSDRRAGASHELPDVGDLYAFLITLHTGMNVNPRFFPPPPNKSANDPRNSMLHVHPSQREVSIPGTFEYTREMKLYSTFSIPLIHGWLPEIGSLAFASLKRTAQSYEDAQNMFFHEEELEDKLQREGLSFEEQSTLEDIATIKAFFASNATQLTPHGLATITAWLAPGSVAILFRNDHFSTLYRHPSTLHLLQLVTDMGYAGHEEVVWESLIDVTGENAEFFSGDFRLVGGAPQTSAAPQSPAEGWTAVTDRQQSQNQSSRAIPGSPRQDPPPQSPNTEQEDHDLALALQLQEEEEVRHRGEIARRQRESELSQQYIEQQGRGQAQGSIPVSQRGGGRGPGANIMGGGPTRGGPELRPAIPPRRSGANPQPVAADPEAGVDAPPPSYEQAANQAAYVPPANHPAHPASSPNGTHSGRRLSAYSTTAAAYGGTSPANVRPARRGTGPPQGTMAQQIPNLGGRRNTAAAGQGGEGAGKDRDCAIM